MGRDSISTIRLEPSVIRGLGYRRDGWLSMSLVTLLAVQVADQKEGMGYGDFKLLAALGAWLGWQQLPIIVLLSSLVGLVFGLSQLYLQKKGIDKQFPFGPYLAIAGWVSLLWGEAIMEWYFASVLGI